MNVAKSFIRDSSSSWLLACSSISSFSLLLDISNLVIFKLQSLLTLERNRRMCYIIEECAKVENSVAKHVFHDKAYCLEFFLVPCALEYLK